MAPHMMTHSNNNSPRVLQALFTVFACFCMYMCLCVNGANVQKTERNRLDPGINTRQHVRLVCCAHYDNCTGFYNRLRHRC